MKEAKRKMDLLANKVVLVTGGSSGIGRASAIAFSHEGADVVVAHMDEGGAAETVDVITRSGGSVDRARKTRSRKHGKMRRR